MRRRVKLNARGPRAGRDAVLDGQRQEAVGLGVDIGQDGDGAGGDNGGGSGLEGVGRHDDLVTPAHPRCPQGDLNGDRAIGHQHRELAALQGGEALGEGA